MPVTTGDVLHVAALARLRLAPEEVARLTSELNDILGHVAELAEAEGGAEAAADRAVEPGAGDGPASLPPDDGVLEAGAADWPAPLRSDDSAPDPLALPPGAIAPEWQDGFFTLPRLGAMEGG